MTAAKEKPVMPPPPAWAIAEPEDVYHARSKSGEMMSSGMLRTFRDCPWQYRQKILGLVPEKDSTAYRFGRAVHKIVLEGIPAFNKYYTIGGPVNPKTGKCYAPDTKAFAEWLAENGIAMERVIGQEEADSLVTMANMVRRHESAAALLDFGWPELVVRAELHGVPCQIRIDWLTQDAAGNMVIVDLKTTDDITWFESDARRYGYMHQLAFYRDVLQATGCAGEPSVSVIALEKKYPFRVGLWHMGQGALDAYALENRIALGEYRKCRETDTWPTGYESPREFGAKREPALV